jgi:hypothetical protein
MALGQCGRDVPPGEVGLGEAVEQQDRQAFGASGGDMECVSVRHDDPRVEAVDAQAHVR